MHHIDASKEMMIFQTILPSVPVVSNVFKTNTSIQGDIQGGIMQMLLFLLEFCRFSSVCWSQPHPLIRAPHCLFLFVPVTFLLFLPFSMSPVLLSSFDREREILPESPLLAFCRCENIISVVFFSDFLGRPEHLKYALHFSNFFLFSHCCRERGKGYEVSMMRDVLPGSPNLACFFCPVRSVGGGR